MYVVDDIFDEMSARKNDTRTQTHILIKFKAPSVITLQNYAGLFWILKIINFDVPIKDKCKTPICFSLKFNKENTITFLITI